MKKLEIRQMESFTGGKDCSETPMETELQRLMCLEQPDEEAFSFPVFDPDVPDMPWYYAFMFQFLYR